jgi:hypothetical protein
LTTPCVRKVKKLVAFCLENFFVMFNHTSYLREREPQFFLVYYRVQSTSYVRLIQKITETQVPHLEIYFFGVANGQQLLLFSQGNPRFYTSSFFFILLQERPREREGGNSLIKH